MGEEERPGRREGIDDEVDNEREKRETEGELKCNSVRSPNGLMKSGSDELIG